MPRAEAGSIKDLSNKLKSKGLQRLRWYCQVCEKQCRDENGFKCHTQSESHVRQIQLVAGNSKKVISDYSQQFIRDFLLQLRTAHGTKPIHINHFYQEYIANKEHVHMNATRWTSLTMLAKHLGQEGICRVEETDKGLHIAWIDNSPEALRRQEAIRKRERMDKGDEEREQRLIQEQVDRAQDMARLQDENDETRELQRNEGEKIKLNFGAVSETPVVSAMDERDGHQGGDHTETITSFVQEHGPDQSLPKLQPVKVTLGSAPNKPKNVFTSKKTPFATKPSIKIEPPKKMSEAERIMKEEIERKRSRETHVGANKRIRV